jgi:hypothetical protein
MSHLPDLTFREFLIALVGGYARYPLDVRLIIMGFLILTVIRIYLYLWNRWSLWRYDRPRPRVFWSWYEINAWVAAHRLPIVWGIALWWAAFDLALHYFYKFPAPFSYYKTWADLAEQVIAAMLFGTGLTVYILYFFVPILPFEIVTRVSDRD